MLAELYVPEKLEDLLESESPYIQRYESVVVVVGFLLGFIVVAPNVDTRIYCCWMLTIHWRFLTLIETTLMNGLEISQIIR